MSGSPLPFDVRLSRFRNGHELIRSWPDYDPRYPLISKPCLDDFLAEALERNSRAGEAWLPLEEMSRQRMSVAFFDKDLQNHRCLESRLHSAAVYLEAAWGPKHARCKEFKAAIRKIRPAFSKGAGRPPAEAVFAAAAEQAEKALALLHGQAAYAPQDASISLSSLARLVAQLRLLNEDIARQRERFSACDQARLELFDGPAGMTHRIVAIKSYLSSLGQGKEHPYYIRFSEALKGGGA
ncbi:MAG: hypothetical protein AB1458_10195 [Bacteroidota bacterium]